VKSVRQEKIEKLLSKDLGEIFRARNKEFLPGVMITLTKVEVSPDLGFAKVYLSLFPSKDPKLDLEKLKGHAGEVRFQLGKIVRNQLRVVPELALYLDDSFDKAQRIDELLNS
jgi:ribosome-binding factor A